MISADEIRATRLCTRCGWTIRADGCGCTAHDKQKPWPEHAWRTIPDPDADPAAAQRIIDAAIAEADAPEVSQLSAGQLIMRAYNRVRLGDIGPEVMKALLDRREPSQ